MCYCYQRITMVFIVLLAAAANVGTNIAAAAHPPRPQNKMVHSDNVLLSRRCRKVLGWGAYSLRHPEAPPRAWVAGLCLIVAEVNHKMLQWAALLRTPVMTKMGNTIGGLVVGTVIFSGKSSGTGCPYAGHLVVMVSQGGEQGGPTYRLGGARQKLPPKVVILYYYCT